MLQEGLQQFMQCLFGLDGDDMFFSYVETHVVLADILEPTIIVLYIWAHEHTMQSHANAISVYCIFRLSLVIFSHRDHALLSAVP